MINNFAKKKKHVEKKCSGTKFIESKKEIKEESVQLRKALIILHVQINNLISLCLQVAKKYPHGGSAIHLSKEQGAIAMFTFANFFIHRKIKDHYQVTYCHFVSF